MHLNKIQTVSAVAAVDLANELIERKLLNIEELAKISDLLVTLYKNHQGGLAIEEKRMEETHFLSLWQVASNQSRIPSLGVEIGKIVNVKAKGILVNWLSCCETLNQAFNIFQKNIPLLNQSECWSVCYQAEYVKLIFKFSSELPYPIMAIERSMVALIKWAEFFTTQKLKIKSASFTFDKPNYSEQYEAIFGLNINFNANTNSIEILSSQLNTPINGANLYLRNLIAERTAKIELDISPSLTFKVQSLLTKNLVKYSKIEAIINSLHMSKATLYRKLKEEQSLFSELIVQERINRLTKVDKLKTDSEEVAILLGFQDVSSYYKFLKRCKANKLLN